MENKIKSIIILKIEPKQAKKVKVDCRYIIIFYILLVIISDQFPRNICWTPDSIPTIPKAEVSITLIINGMTLPRGPWTIYPIA